MGWPDDVVVTGGTNPNISADVQIDVVHLLLSKDRLDRTTYEFLWGLAFAKLIDTQARLLYSENRDQALKLHDESMKHLAGIQGQTLKLQP